MMSNKLREGLKLVVEGFGEIENKVEAEFAGRKGPADELQEAQATAKVTELRTVLEGVIEEEDLSLEQFAIFTSAIYEAIEEVDPDAFVEDDDEEYEDDEYEYGEDDDEELEDEEENEDGYDEGEEEYDGDDDYEDEDEEYEDEEEEDEYEKEEG